MPQGFNEKKKEIVQSRKIWYALLYFCTSIRMNAHKITKKE